MKEGAAAPPSKSNQQTNNNIPTILIITRPQTEIDYPLWKEAKEVWAANQPHVDKLARDLTQAGFRTMEHTMEAYPCEIPFARWQSMVKQWFWSTFANFNDDELEAACQTLVVKLRSGSVPTA
jgi:hypothetical protein